MNTQESRCEDLPYQISRHWAFTIKTMWYSLEKEMATHSSIPAWKIPQTAEPDGL